MEQTCKHLATVDSTIYREKIAVSCGPAIVLRCQSAIIVQHSHQESFGCFCFKAI